MTKKTRRVEFNEQMKKFNLFIEKFKKELEKKEKKKKVKQTSAELIINLRWYIAEVEGSDFINTISNEIQNCPLYQTNTTVSEQVLRSFLEQNYFIDYLYDSEYIKSTRDEMKKLFHPISKKTNPVLKENINNLCKMLTQQAKKAKRLENSKKFKKDKVNAILKSKIGVVKDFPFLKGITEAYAVIKEQLTEPIILSDNTFLNKISLFKKEREILDL
jgi:hypothetical protein